MSRSCIEVLKEKSLIEADSKVARWKIGVWSRWSQFKISCYEVTFNALLMNNLIRIADTFYPGFLVPLLVATWICADATRWRIPSTQGGVPWRPAELGPFSSQAKQNSLNNSELRDAIMASEGKLLVRVVVVSIVTRFKDIYNVVSPHM